MINLGVIGATGSVGSSVMSVCEAWPDKIHVKALAANHMSEKLKALAEKFSVQKVYAYEETGEHGLEEIACDSEIEHVARYICNQGFVFSIEGRKDSITCE